MSAMEKAARDVADIPTMDGTLGDELLDGTIMEAVRAVLTTVRAEVLDMDISHQAAAHTVETLTAILNEGGRNALAD